MNIIILQRYKNELIIIAMIIFTTFAYLYKLSANDYVNENRAIIQKQIREISEIKALKEQWGGKEINNKIKVLKTVVPPSKVASFKKKSKKLVSSYKNLTGDELSKLTNKLINLPVQIVRLKINKEGKNQYTMEFTCKW